MEQQQKGSVYAVDPGPAKGGRVRFNLAGVEYVFRVPDLEDYAYVDRDLPLLPTDAPPEVPEDKPEEILSWVTKDPARTIRFMERVNAMLIRTCLSHRLVLEFPLEPDPTVVPIRSIQDQGRIYVFLILGGMAGFTNESAAELVPFVETTGPS